MRINERRRQILTTIAQSPRRAIHFTHGHLERITSPVVIERWLKEMAEHGYLCEDNGVYSITVKGRQTLDGGKKEVEVSYRDWRNSVYKTGDGQPIGNRFQRPGSDHSHIKSKGLGC